MVEVWESGEKVVRMNYQNTCRRLELDGLLIPGQDRQEIVGVQLLMLTVQCGGSHTHTHTQMGNSWRIDG